MTHPLVRCLVLIAAFVCGALGIDDAHAAYQPGAVVGEPLAPAITGGHWTGYTQLHMPGYLNPSDGGEGILKYMPSGCVYANGTPAAVDNGFCFQDADGNKFQRTQFTGDSHQYGLVAGSPYDCSPTTGVAVAACVGFDSEPILANMFTAALANGTPIVTTGGAQLYIGTTLNTPAELKFTCGAVPTRNGSVLNNAGTIWVAHTKFINAGNSSEPYGCLVLPSWYLTTYHTDPTTIAQFYAIRDAEISNGDLGVMIGGPQTTVHDFDVRGFDNDYMWQTSPSPNAYNLVGDGSVCFFVNNIGSRWHGNHMSCQGSLTQSSDSNEYFSPSNVVAGPSNVCRITIVALPSSPGPTWPVTNVQDGMLVFVSGQNNTSGAVQTWNAWKARATGSNDTWDLVSPDGVAPDSYCSGGTLDGPSFTGKITPGSNLITGVSSFSQLNEQMILGGLAGIPGSTHIQRLWPARGIIVMDTTIPLTTAGATGTITSSGGAFAAQSPCINKGDGSGPCFALSASVRLYAGNSLAGVDAGHNASVFMVGGPSSSDSVSGFTFNDGSFYGVEIPFNFNYAQRAQVTNISTDSIPKLKDDAISFALVQGVSKGLDFTNITSAKSGTGVTLQGSTNNGCLNMVNSDIGSYEVDPGMCLQATNLIGISNQILVADGALRAKADGYVNSMSIVPEDAVAQSVISTIDLVGITAGSASYGGHLELGGFSPTVSGAGTGAFATGGDANGFITAGTSPTNQIVLTFASQWQKRPNCPTMTDLTMPAIRFWPIFGGNTTSATWMASTPPAAADLLSYTCIGRTP